MSASTARTLRGEQDGVGAAARRVVDDAVGAGAGSSSALPMPQVTPIARQPVGVRADDVEGAVADHHRARRAEQLERAGERLRLGPRRGRSSSGPAMTSKCSRRPIASSSGSAKCVRLGGRDREPVAGRAPRAPRGCRARRSSRSARRPRSARGSRRCRRSTIGASCGHAEQLAEARARTAGRCRAAAPRRARAGRPSLSNA